MSIKPGAGRRRKPAILHVLQGTLETRHKGCEFEPVAKGALGDPPEDFTADEIREWNFIRENAPAQMLATLDRRLLVTWCQTCVAYDQANIQLKKHGMLIKNRHGIPVKSPLLNIINDQLKHIRILAEQLGFSPSGRARLQTPHHDDSDGEWKRLKQMNRASVQKQPA
jgi:P27 family predicted phage terminase small subunit